MVDPPPQRAILVLGVHRSGTSALVRVLNLLGAELGPGLMAPVPGENDLGFWEPRDLVDLHDGLLRALGSSWDDPAPLPPRWWQGRVAEPFRRALVERVRERFGEAPLWALKDPRLCRLLPLWRSILGELRCAPACVVITRNPHEVADSLAQRNDFPASQSYLLWLGHMLSAEEYSQNLPRVFVTYDGLLADWRATARRIADELRLSWPRTFEEVAPEVDAFLNPGLRKHHLPDSLLDEDPDLSAWVRGAYHELVRASEQGETPQLGRRFAAIRARVLRASQLYEPYVVWLQSRIADLGAGVAEADAQVRTLEADLRAQSVVGQELKARAAETGAQVRALGADLRAQFAVLRAQSLASHQMIAALRNELASNRLQLLQTQQDCTLRAQELEARRAEIRGILSSRSWRLTAPLRSVWDWWEARGASPRGDGPPSRQRVPANRRSSPLAVARRDLGRLLSGVTPRKVTRLAFSAVAVPRASIIIPAYNEFRHTHACLVSVLENTAEPAYEVIVVDDHSSDATRNIEQYVDNVRVIRNDDNLGFVEACNRGAAAARGEFLVFLNNDTCVTSGWLDALLRPLNEDADVGLVGAKLVYPDGRLQEAGGIVFSDASAWNFGRGEDAEDPAYSFAREVDYCSGACLAIRRQLFTDIGMFDARYAPAYYEDTDLAFAVRDAGKRVVYQPSAEIVHVEGATAGTDPRTGPKRFQEVNREKFRAKWSQALARQPAPGSTTADAASRDTGPRVLVIDAVTPRPDHDSGSVRMWNILRILRRLGCRVCFIADNQAYDGRYTRALQEIGVEALYHPYIHSIEQHIEESGSRYDVVMLSRVEVASRCMALVRRHCASAKVIFDTVDLHYLRKSREAMLGEPADPLEIKRVKGEEIAAIFLADVTLVVSPVEQELLDHEAPGARVEIVSNIHAADPTNTPFEERAGILFIANFEHPPNGDGLEYYLREIHPLIRHRCPEVELTVIGAGVPVELEAMAGAGVRFVGYVADIRTYFSKSRLSIAPLRYGAGVKGKINTSMSLGVPVVTTTIGAEGMGLEHGKDVLIGDTPKAFAQSVVRLYSDAELWSGLVRHGLHNVEANFSFERAERSLAKITELDDSRAKTDKRWRSSVFPSRL